MTLLTPLNFRRFIPWLILILSILTGLVVFTGILPGARPLLVLFFYILCPGLALIRLFRLRDPLTEVVLVIALSLAVDATVAMILLYAGAWSYVTGLLIVIGISMLAAVFSIGQSSRVDDIDRRQARWKGRTAGEQRIPVPSPPVDMPVESRPESPSEHPIGLPVTFGPHDTVKPARVQVFAFPEIVEPTGEVEPETKPARRGRKKKEVATIGARIYPMSDLREAGESRPRKRRRSSKSKPEQQV